MWVKRCVFSCEDDLRRLEITLTRADGLTPLTHCNFDVRAKINATAGQWQRLVQYVGKSAHRYYRVRLCSYYAWTSAIYVASSCITTMVWCICAVCHAESHVFTEWTCRMPGCFKSRRCISRKHVSAFCSRDHAKQCGKQPKIKPSVIA